MTSQPATRPPGPFDALVDPVFEHDTEYRIVRANRAYLHCAGVSLEQALGRRYWEVFPRGDGPMAGCREALGRDRPLAEDEFTTDGGRTYLSRSFPLMDTAGRVQGGFHFLQDVTAQRRTERDNTLLGEAFQQAGEALYIADSEQRIQVTNPAFRRLFGYSDEELRGRPEEQLWPNRPAGEAIRAALAQDGHWRGETVHQARDGSAIPVLLGVTLLRGPDGTPTGTVGNLVDLRDRKRAEAALTRANRALRTLSAVNRVITHGHDETTLPAEVCRAIVEHGGYCFAWVGYLQDDPQHTIRPMGRAGLDQGYLEAVTISWADQPLGRGAAGQAARSGRPCVVQDIAADPCLAPWRREALARGFAAVIALPLRSGDRVFGVLVIYAAEAHAFDATEAERLEELASDLAYGLVSLRSDAARAQAEALLQIRNRALEATRNGVMITDARHGGYPLVYVNPAFTRITGYTPQEVLGRNPALLQGEDRDQPELENIRHAVRECDDGVALLRNYRKDGTLFWNELHISPVRDDGGEVTHFVGVINDVTEHRRYEEELAYHAYHDQLTGLPNRDLMHDRLAQALLYARRHSGSAAILFLDLDRFKMINDGLGHQIGDRLLVETARRLAGCAREGDTVCRYGGDEFVLVLPEMGEADAITRFAARLQKTVNEPFKTGEHTLRTTASIGASIYPRDGADANTLLRNADAAVHRAKELGRNNLQYYTAELNARVMEQLILGERLRRALGDDELLLYYQPQVDLRNGRITGMEALLRWQQPESGLVSPAQFIPLAESTGLILPIGAWVLREACRQARTWQESGLPPLVMAVNLSPRQLDQRDLATQIAAILEETGLAPQCLELELTESAVMTNPQEMQQRLDELKALGVRLSIDDFGTGYSSLGYLSRFPFDKLKIDQSFVRDVTHNPHDASIATTIIAMAENLGLRVIAEGVESEAQLAFLNRHRCGEIQGYLFSPPVPAADAEALLREPRTLLPTEESGEPKATLLILDDEANITRALHRLLRREYQVLTANDADTAFELLALNEVQVVISDQRMPAMTGTEFFARVKELYPDIVRIILSGYTDLKTVTEAVNRGWVYKFLTKPWEDDDLRRQVEDAFRHHERQRRREG